jgi:hypothetical protein
VVHVEEQEPRVDRASRRDEEVITKFTSCPFPSHNPPNTSKSIPSHPHCIANVVGARIQT